MKITLRKNRIVLDITKYEYWLILTCLEVSYGFGGIEEKVQLQIARLSSQMDTAQIKN